MDFNLPLMPHFGGVHEVIIIINHNSPNQSCKKAIWAVLGNANVNDEEMTTAFIGVEALSNSHPLTYQSAHPHFTTNAESPPSWTNR